MKILVTGDRGMIGSRLVMGLLDAGCQVIGIDRSGQQEEGKNYVHYCVELGEKNRVRDIIINERVDRVIHLAALAHTEGISDASWQKYKYANVECAKNIFDAVGDKPVLFISTVDVYGFYDGKNLVNSKSKIKPASKYGKSKALAEKECKKLKYYDIFRFSPVYSDDMKRDIQKRYYLKYPCIAYIIGRGSKYEVLNIKKAVSEMVGWCGKAPQNSIRILKDEKMLRTNDCIRDERKAGKAKIVIYVPKVVAILGYKVLYQLFGGNEKTYLFNKAVYPLKSGERELDY